MKQRKPKRLIKIFLLVLLAVSIAALGLFCAVLGFAARDKQIAAREQETHIAALEAACQEEYIPRSEEEMTGFNPQAAASNGVRLNEIQMLATHNSYKRRPNAMARAIMRYILIPLRFAWGDEWGYSFDTLTRQLGNGIRSFELDVMREKEGFRCAHIPLIDYASNSPDFGLALKEIDLWSQHNPGHLPITILVEPKTTVLSGGMLFRPFKLGDVLLLEEMAARQFGERLYTPADMLSDYESFVQLRADNAYPLLSALLGKIIVIYHYDENNTADYAALDPSMRTRRMFPSVQRSYSKEASAELAYTCFIIINGRRNGDAMEKYTAQNMLIRTVTDSYPWHDDEWRDEAFATGAFLQSTDYPPRDDLREDPYAVAFDNGATVRLREP